MGEKNLWSKVGLIVLLVGLSIWQIAPSWDKQKHSLEWDKLKPGIDLGGGYSALFEIDDTGAESDPQLAERVMDILKRRIDPGSTRNLIWRPIGRNRLEIQMPRRAGATGVREQYDNLRKELLASNITEAQIRVALALPPKERDIKLQQLELGVAARKPAFANLAAADDLYRRLAGKSETQPAAETQPTTAPATPPSTRPGEELGAAIEARMDRISDILKTNLNIQPLLDGLELSKENKVRIANIAKAKQQYPELAGKIDQLVQLHDQWSERRGVLEDPSDLLRLLKGAGVLEFRILATRDPVNRDMLTAPKPEYHDRVAKYTEQLEKRGPRPETGDLYAWFKVAKPEENSIMQGGEYVVGQYLGTPYVLAHATPDMTLLKGQDWSLVAAHQDRDPGSGRLAVAFQLDARGGDKFSALTSTNINRPLCIFLDNEAISAANIRSTISTHGQITGNFSQKDVSYLVQTLEAGALPARLKDTPIQERNVGPSLGDTNIRKGLIAVAASLIATIIFMIIYYAYNGAIADVALMMNLIITLGAMSFLGATFTLPGIAGLILTLGMAVDANVLIFERVREELGRGVSAKMAVKLGYERAFSAIFDGHVTSILTAGILYWIGSEEIKGFGLTLGLGLALSLFTALWVTRQFYYVMIPMTLNRDEVRKAWMVPIVIALLGGLLVAIGYAFHRQVNLGRFLAIMGGTGVVMMACMWAFRILYKALGHQKANRLPMMKLLAKPQIDWMTKYKKFWILSGVIIGCGLVFLTIIPKDEVMDIEFVGGTNVQISLTDKNMTDAQVLDYIKGNKPLTAVAWLQKAAEQLRHLDIQPDGQARFVVTSPGGELSSAQLQALLSARLAQNKKGDPVLVRNGITAVTNGVTVQFSTKDNQSPDLALAKRMFTEEAADYAVEAAKRMHDVRIQSVIEGEHKAFELVTTETARELVAESLVSCSLRDLLEVKKAINATLVTDPIRAPAGVFPISRDDGVLGDVIGGGSRESIADFKGGLVLVFDNLQPPASVADVEQRLRQMRMQPDFGDTGWRRSNVIPLDPAGVNDAQGKPLFKKIAIAVADDNQIYVKGGSNDQWQTNVADREKALSQAALGSSQSLERVTTFLPQVASEASQKAVIAVILSFIAIAGYLWLRFGSVDFGLSGIIALYHDVMVALAGVLACHYLYDTWLGHLLGLRDFKIDLNIIAALLTIVGYSITDSIVIFDRIRENRGRLGQISPTLINDSINQTLSRTVLTVFTVFLVVFIMYVWGGEGIHGFAFAMLIGCITGVYSTIAVATPMVIHPHIMWGVTVGLSGLTSAALATWMTENNIIRAIVVVLALGIASGVAYWQYTLHQGEQAALPGAGRHPVKV